MYRTGNPIPSAALEDMADNANNFDGFVNSTKNSFIDRLGVTRKTIHGMNSEFESNILSMGFTRVGTFAAGATLTNTRQTLLWDVADGGDGQEYGWSGAFPPSGKVVPPGRTPLTTGGIAVGAWISRFDPELRIQVRETISRSYAEAGLNLIGDFSNTGLVVNTITDVVLWKPTGVAYAYSGALPHTIGAGETPIGNQLWASKANTSLREQVAKLSAANKIGILVGKMWAGKSVKIACYGDSTTDGNNTTGWTANPVDGSNNAVGNSDHNLTAPNAWPVKLQNILREMNKGNTNIHVWNAGYSGKRMEDGWALRNYDAAVTNNPFYGTPDITLIGFGLNDTGNVSSSIDNFVVNYRALITKIINYGTVPVLLTTDPGFRTGLYGESPIRDHKEARRELDSALKSLAAEFGVPIIDMGLALKGWIQNNTDGFRWSVEQSDAIHFSNNGHAFKAQFAATHLFNDIVLFDGGKKIINTWSSQAAYNGTYAKIYENANSLQGAVPLFTSGAPKNTAMMTMWVWATAPNSHLVYNGTENEGYNAGEYTVPPSISVKEFFAGSAISKQLISVGDQLSEVRSSDSPYIHSKLKYGLNKVTYVSGDGDLLFYGFFSIIESNKKASGNVLKDVGRIVSNHTRSTGTFIEPLQEASGLNNTAGVFANEKISISFNAICPKGFGLILLHGQSYSGDASSVTNNEQNALLLYHDPAGTIGVYKSTYGNDGFIKYNRLVASGGVWPSDTIEARVEIDKEGGVQRLTLFDAWAGGNVIYQFNLNQAGKRSRWGGLVGGFLCNTDHIGVPTAVAAINQMVINRG